MPSSVNTYSSLLFFALLCSGGCTNRPDNAGGNSGANSPGQTFGSYHLTDLQQRAVAQLLADSTGWRLATREDCTDSLLAMATQDDSSYQPYFKEDDFNSDGKADFAIVLKKDSTFGLYWFANGDSSYSKPILLTSAEWFDECGFSIGKRPGFLGFGRFYSDIGKFYQWDDKLHLLREIVTDEGEDSTATDVE